MSQLWPCHGPRASPADSVLGNMFCFCSRSLSLLCRGGAHWELPLLAHAPVLIIAPAAHSSKSGGILEMADLRYSSLDR